MATLTIPVRSDIKAYDFQINLDGIVFILEFGFNTRANRWYMSIYDQSEDLILGDIPLLTDTLFLDQYVDDRLPPGEFLLLDETGEGKNPGPEDLGNDVKMLYREKNG
jgi:hypothetical protein